MTLEVILAQAAEKRHAHRGATPAGALCDMAAEPQGRGTARRARVCRVGLLWERVSTKQNARKG